MRTRPRRVRLAKVTGAAYKCEMLITLKHNAARLRTDCDLLWSARRVPVLGRACTVKAKRRPLVREGWLNIKEKATRRSRGGSTIWREGNWLPIATSLHFSPLQWESGTLHVVSQACTLLN
eukprot:4038390-Pleurochrysis_carterae.AAC.1